MNDFNARNFYDVYTIVIQMRDKLVGGKPKNPDILATHIAIKTQHNDEQTAEQISEATAALLEPTEEKSWNGFLSDPTHGLFIDAFAVKAMFKESASMLRILVERRGSKQVMQHAFEIKGLTHEMRVYLGRAAPYGSDAGPNHVQTPRGPRNAIKKVDYVQGAELAFELWVLATHGSETRHIGEKEVRAMLTFAQENGLGADRSQGRGKFSVVSFEKTQTATPFSCADKKRPVAEKAAE